MSKLKRMVALGTTLATILWAVGVAIPVQATVISNGDLVKVATDSAVYLIQGNQRRVFPHANVYHSWGYPADFSTVKTVSASELEAYEEGNPVPFRDGSMFRGTTTSFEGFEETAVFYVEDAKIRPIKSEEIYQELFDDPEWKLVTWVPDDLLTKFAYPQGTMIDSADKHPDGCLIKYPDSDTIYLIDEGKKREITPEAITLNRMGNLKVLTVDPDETYPEGAKITGLEEALVTPGWSTVVSELTIALASDTPEVTNVPLTAQNIPFTKVKLTNGGAATAKISSLTVKRTGLGSYDDFDNIGIFEGEVQYGTYKSLSSSTESATFNFSSPITLAPNEVKYLTIKANYKDDDTANHINQLGITAINSDATVSGLPVYGKAMTAVDLKIGNVDISYESLADSNVQLGEDNVELAVIKFDVGNVEDVEVISFTLEQQADLNDADLANIAAYYSTTKLADCSLDDDRLTCILDTPFEIEKGDNEEIRIVGDIEGGRPKEESKFEFEEEYDVNVQGKSYGYRVPVTITDEGETLELEAGDVTVNFAGPAAADIVQGQEDVVLANFEITSNTEDADLDRLSFTIEVGTNATTSADYIEPDSVKLYDVNQGLYYDGEADSTNNEWDFDMNHLTLEAGVKRTFELRFDVPDDVPGNTTYRASWDADGSDTETEDDDQIEIEGLTSDESLVKKITPGTLDGKKMTVKAPALKLSVVSLNPQTVVAGTDDVLLYKAVLDADGEEIKVNEITFTFDADNFAETDIDQLTLYKDNIEIKTLNGSDISGNTVKFSLGSDLKVSPAANVTLTLEADIAQNVESATIQVKIAELSDEGTYFFQVEAEDVDGDDVDVPGDEIADWGSEVTVTGSGELTVSFDTESAEVSKDRYVLAGQETPWLAKIKLTAKNEDIKITDLTLTNDGGNIADSVDKIQIYENDKSTLVAEEEWTTGTTITFDDINYTVEEGTDYLYVKAILNEIGPDVTDTAKSGHELELSISDIVAEGVDSDEAITTGEDGGLTLVAGSSKNAKIVGARIASIENALADGALSSGRNTVAKYTITVDPTTNATSSGEIVDLQLDTIAVAFTGNVAATNITIEREGGVDGTDAFISSVTSTEIVEGTVTFTKVDGKTDWKIESGQTATFIIKADIEPLIAGTEYSLMTKITGLDTANPTWSDELGEGYSGVRLDNNTVDGAKLTRAF